MLFCFGVVTHEGARPHPAYQVFHCPSVLNDCDQTGGCSSSTSFLQPCLDCATDHHSRITIKEELTSREPPRRTTRRSGNEKVGAEVGGQRKEKTGMESVNRKEQRGIKGENFLNIPETGPSSHRPKKLAMERVPGGIRARDSGVIVRKKIS